MDSRAHGEVFDGTPIDVDALSAEERTKLGMKISAAREAKQLSRLELSEMAHVDRKTLRTIESGQRAGQPAKLKALLEALNIPQTSDYDRWDEGTRFFIASTAPMFAALPDAMRSEAHAGVVDLLNGKLVRAAGIPRIGVAASSEDEEEHEQFAARPADPDSGGED